MWRSVLCLPSLLFLVAASLGTLASAAEPAPLPEAHEVKDVEGWQVRVDQRLLAEENQALGTEALTLLADRLRDIKRRLPDDRIEQLQKVVIQLDLSHGRMTSMQYHPSAGWLRDNGYSEELERCVHIPVAAGFISPGHQQVQPWSVLHELAHAYHDQVLDFRNVKVSAAYRAYESSGEGKQVAHMRGYRTDHYALTDAKEFFAEMSEAYIGQNDFYPFNRGELRLAFPAIDQLMAEIWGPMPKVTAKSK